MRFAHTAPRITPWRAVALLLGAVALALGSMIGLTVTDTGQRASSSGAGQFIVQCHGAVKVATFDPIVFPGQPTAGHQHEFYGNQSISASSDYLSLYRSSTSCDAAGDTAAYWAPTLYSNGVRLPATRLTAYYIAQRTDLEDIPPNLRMIAGDKTSTAPQSTKVVYWGCGNGSGTSTVNSPPACGSGQLTLHILFPDCSNGQSDSADHQSHTAYSNGGSCPPGFPHHFPQLVARYEYGVRPDPKTLSLSSGSVNTMHGDFVNAWDVDRLHSVIDFCIRSGRQCTAAQAIAAQGPAHPK